ncbi:MAG TPA: hypothetical protein VHS59_09635 [Bacillota bacterium]|nr:hypothetical protein [Bacillota bacterium]
MNKLSYGKNKQGRLVFRKAQPAEEEAILEDEWTEYDALSGRIFAHQDSVLPAGSNGENSLRDNLVDLE